MRRVPMWLVGSGLALTLVLVGCEPLPPSAGNCFDDDNGGDVTLTVPSAYDVTVEDAVVPAHDLTVNTPAASTEHLFEIDMQSATVSGRGSVIIHTALSPATTMTRDGRTINIRVTGSDRASSARFGVTTSTGVIEANATSGWIRIQFGTGTLSGFAQLTTDDPRVPSDLRTYTTCFTGTIAVAAAGG